MVRYRFDPLRYPASPGCYLLKDSGGKVLYAGATVNLRRQLSVFFDPKTSCAVPEEDRLQSGSMAGSVYYEKMPRLSARIADIEVILLNNAQEGLVLENSLIRRLHPPFNWATMIDGTNLVYLALTDEPFPRFIPYHEGRQAERATAGERFGPYSTPRLRDRALKAINRTFGLRTCDPLAKEVCLSYHLGICSAPCAGHITAGDYAARIAEAVNRLRRESRMEAGSFPDLDRPASEDAVYQEAGKAVLVHLEKGRLTGLDLVEAPEGDLAAFLLRYYDAACPAALILPVGYALDTQALAAALSAASRHPVDVVVAAGKTELELVKIARMNYDFQVKGI